MFKRGITKISISLIFIILLLLIVTNSFATKENQSEIDNMKVVSETKNNIKVTWYPVQVGLIDKEYNITIENLENKQRELDLDAFFNAISGGIDTLVTDSIKLVYLTDLTKTLDDYSEVCTDREVIISEGESNKTIKTVRSCTSQNNPRTISYKGWKEYPIDEARDKQKQELILQKINQNGKITLVATGKIYLKLKFKTSITAKSDGTYGNDGNFALLLDGVSYHPTFNTSYAKRYLINITANDAIDANYTHNITFAFTGNSSDLGSNNRSINIGSSNVLACDNIHVIFNGTTELDREIWQCNTSNFQVLFRNQNNITRNGTCLNCYEIYYDPSGSNYQPPRDYSAIGLPGSDHWDYGENTSRWIYDNNTTGNGSWRNYTTSAIANGAVNFRADSNNEIACIYANTGNNVNITQGTWSIQFEFIRDTKPTASNTNSVGLNDRPCPQDPNTPANAIVWGNEAQSAAGVQNMRNINAGSITTSLPLLTRQINNDEVNIFYMNATRSTISSGEHFVASNGSSSGVTSILGAQTSLLDVSKFVLLRFMPEGGAYKINYTIDNLLITQRVNSSPVYNVFQENVSVPQANILTIPTRACTAEDRSNSTNNYDAECDGTYPASCGPNLTNDFLNCKDDFSETQRFRKNRFTGLHIQAFNSSITDCSNITSVTLCYRWWTNGDNLKNCTVAVDANGNSSYSIVNSTCPNVVNATCPEASPTPTMACTDVTSLESWTCNSFFGPNGTKAVARHELSTNDPGQARILMTDALFFNVTYVGS